MAACRNTAATLPFENRKNIDRIALSPNDRVLITVDEGTLPDGACLNDLPWHILTVTSSTRHLSLRTLCPSPDGRALLVNFFRRVVLHHFNFKERVRSIKFAPNGRCGTPGPPTPLFHHHPHDHPSPGALSLTPNHTPTPPPPHPLPNPAALSHRG